MTRRLLLVKVFLFYTEVYAAVVLYLRSQGVQ